MDAQHFLTEFEHIANAPGGIERLRDLALNFAVQGKLVPQVEHDIHARDLFIIIQEHRAQVVKGKKRRRSKHHTEINSLDAPFTLPKNWIFVRNSDLFGLIKGKNPKDLSSASGTYAYLDIEALDRGNVQRYTSDERAPRASEADILVVCDGSRSGLVLNGKDGVIGSTLALVDTPKFLQPFIKLIFRRSYQRMNSEMKGVAIPHLDTANLLHRITGLPPLTEQSRIVAKVDEIMVLCDKLEALKQSQQKLKRLIRAATLDAFVAATNAGDLKQSWLKLHNGLDFWGDDEQTPFELRNAIGAIACRGLLTDAGVFQPDTNDDSLPPLPAGWLWQTLGDLSTYITSGSRGWKQYLASTGDIFIRSQDIKHDAVVLEAPAYVLLPEKTEGKRTLVQPGDLLLTITGGNVGKCAQVPDLPKPAYVSQHVALIRVKDPESTPFIHFWMTNIYGGRKFLGRYIYGDKPGLNLTQVASVPVPMPPKEIQAQIVGSLEQYASICNRLLQQVMEAQKTATLLATAAVASITGIRTEEEEELKVPKTELISKLRLGENPGIKEQAPLAAILAGQNGEMASKDLWQRYGGEIDTFYAQLKLEVSKGWILEPAIAEMRQVEAI